MSSQRVPNSLARIAATSDDPSSDQEPLELTPSTYQPSPDAAKRRFQGLPSDLKSNWPIWLVAAVVFADGLLSVVTMLAVRFEEPARLFNAPIPFGVHHASRLLTLVFGFGLIYLYFQVLQRRRAAWRLTLALAIAATVVHFGHGHLLISR